MWLYYVIGTRIVDFSNIHGNEIFVVFVNLKISGLLCTIIIYKSFFSYTDQEYKTKSFFTVWIKSINLGNNTGLFDDFIH